MSVHFYAGYWQFGVGFTNFEGEPYCSLLSFDSREERDAWVAADHFDNNWHRSAVSRREALPLMRAELAELRGYDSKGYAGWWIDGVFYASIGDAFAAFFKAEAAARRRVGVPGISPHSLRRTFCTLSRDAGVPDRDIMAAGGWNSPQMLDYYDMSRRGLNGKAGDGLQDYLGKEDDETGFQRLANTR